VSNIKHGCVINGKRTKLYRKWTSIRERCLCKSCKDYPNFGGKGIRISKEFENYSDFKEWAFNNGYRDDIKCTLVRKNINKDYTPTNCYWSVFGRCILYSYLGKKLPLKEIIKLSECGLTDGTVKSRLARGWSLESALMPAHDAGQTRVGQQKGRVKRYEFRDKFYTAQELKKLTQSKYSAELIVDRLKKDWSVLDACLHPKFHKVMGRKPSEVISEVK